MTDLRELTTTELDAVAGGVTNKTSEHLTFVSIGSFNGSGNFGLVGNVQGNSAGAFSSTGSITTINSISVSSGYMKPVLNN